MSSHMLAATLVKWGHEVVATVDGLEAWTVLQEKNPPLLAILDWIMPGMDGVEVCRRVRQLAGGSQPYLILLTAKNSKEDLVEGLEAGADDFLSKPFHVHELRVRLQVGERIVELQRSLAVRVVELEKAIVEREKAEAELRDLTLTDELTDLYNRRGFFTLGDHHLKGIRRTAERVLVLYADMDGLKQINDTLGHNEGSLAIQRMAVILRQTFRDSDIVARIGGDEFAILAANNQSGETDGIINRVQEAIRIYNQQRTHHYALSLSIGGVCVEPNNHLTIEQIIEMADSVMYTQKRKKREQVVDGERKMQFGIAPTSEVVIAEII
jgi:diguanylate cyclase (GGDEF)-like protein